MSNVIDAAGKFGNKVNALILHHSAEQVKDLIVGALQHRTEVFKPGHTKSFMITGVVFQPIVVSDDYYTDRVETVTLPNAQGSINNYSQCADVIIDNATTRGLKEFIEHDSLALSLMVLGGGITHNLKGDIVEVGPRLIQDDDYPDKFVENPEFYGCHWNDLGNFILGSKLNQCTCGLPDTVIQFVYDGIEHLGMDDKAECHIKFEDRPYWVNRMAAVKKYGDGPLYFLWHNLEVLEFTEHGSSAPGWLTGKGEHLLLLLKHVLETDV